MNNLPIATSIPQAATKPAQAAQTASLALTAPPLAAAPAPSSNPAQTVKSAPAEKTAQAAKPAEEGAPQGKTFGDVLARQVSDATPPEDAPEPKKIAAKSADEIFANIKSKTDDATAKAAPGDASSNLPAEMLATLIPQAAAATQGVVATQSAPSATLAEDSAFPKKVPASTTAANGIPGADTLGGNQNIPAAGNSALKHGATHGAAQIGAQKDAAFSNMMETITASNTAPKLSSLDEKAAALAAAPLPGAAALASMQAATASLAPANVLPAQVTIDTPVSHDKWGDEFNQKITWLSSQKEQTAELHLNPPQLGPMDVVLKVSGDQATALFTSPHAAVREAVEQALPRLREMMAENGIMLGNATVSDQAPRNQQDNRENKSSSSRTGIGGISGSSMPAGNLSTRVSPISRHNGIVDTFA